MSKGPRTYLWLVGNEGMDKEKGYVGTTVVSVPAFLVQNADDL